MTAIPAALRIPRVRWSIGVLLGAGSADQFYFDWINLSVGSPQLQQEFGLTDGELGWLFSGFFWSYALLQIPTGMILDRFGVTSVYRVSAFPWSIASGATAFAGGFGGILAARLVLGIAEGPRVPAASAKATGYWFPRGERAMATSIFDAAAKFANVIGVPLVALAVVQFGWRWGFAITGFLSFLYFLAFLIVYRDPSRHPRLSSAEHDYIPRRRRHSRRPGRERPSRDARLPAAQPQGMGADDRLCRLRVLVLPVPHLAAELPRAVDAHEHPEIRGVHGDPLDLRHDRGSRSSAVG